MPEGAEEFVALSQSLDSAWPRRDHLVMAAVDPEQARDRLLAERSRIQGLLGENRAERRNDGPIDALAGDAGVDTTAAATDLGLRDDLNYALAEVDAALDRVEAGTYGLDEVTGEPIDPARLEAEPTARRNIG